MASISSYEQAKADLRDSSLPDKVIWEESISFRGQQYRFLHHQDGICGHVNVQLIEAKNLKLLHGNNNRNQWSATKMAHKLGPLKHLGLINGDEHLHVMNSLFTFSLAAGEEAEHSEHIFHDGKPAGTDPCKDKVEIYRSRTVANDNDPKWSEVVGQPYHSNTPTGKNSSDTFSIPLRKGLIVPDGSPVILNVNVMVDENVSTESQRPNKTCSGTEKKLGEAKVDLSGICFGRCKKDDGGQQTDEIWVDLHPPAAPSVAAAASVPRGTQNGTTYVPQEIEKLKENMSKEEAIEHNCSKVRLLISYIPYGVDPAPKDVVCLEAFARRPIDTSSSRPIIPPSQPMVVMAIRGPYLHIRYNMPRAQQNNSKPSYGHLRLHRNTIFVIERWSLVDGVWNMALKPTDILLSTTYGQTAQSMASPYVEAAIEVSKPALLTGKLALSAAQTGAGFGLDSISTAAKVLRVAADITKQQCKDNANVAATNRN